MKLIVQLNTLIIVLGICLVVACKKTTTTPPATTTPTPTACNGKTLCFKLDGTEESHDGEWRKIAANGTSPARYRIYWEEGTGTTYKNIEMDVYASSTGTYNIKNSGPYAANDAAFQYFIANGNKNIQGQTGTITISAIDNTNNTISGTFTVTASDGTTTYQVTEGNFVKAPLKP